MKSQLAGIEKGWTQRALFGGLALVLERKGRTWRLALGRIGKPPSVTEAETCARAFRLPAGIEWSWGQRKRKKITYQVAECVWIEEMRDGNTT
ncbi:MAG: hypothetical protein R2932_59150 [Caldilineaceae bacterium]